MVKGIARRVVIIKSPDPKIFDEAIFIVRDDAVRSGVTSAEILHEAQETARRYLRTHGRRTHLRIPAPVFALAGAAVTAAAWILTALL